MIWRRLGSPDRRGRLQLVAAFICSTFLVAAVVVEVALADVDLALGSALFSGALVGLGAGALIVWAVVAEWRRHDGLDALRATELAVLVGKLPEDAEPRLWVPRLERLDDRATPMLLLSLSWVLVAGTRLLDTADRAPGLGWVVMLGAALFYGIPRFVIARRRRPTVRRLLGQLTIRWNDELNPVVR